MNRSVVPMLVCLAIVFAACGGTSGNSNADTDPGNAVLEGFGIDVDASDADSGSDSDASSAAPVAGSAGTATVQVVGLTLQAAGDLCIYQSEFFQFSGTAELDDGAMVLISIDGDRSEDIDGDGIADTVGTLEINFEVFGPGEGELQAEVVDFSALDLGEPNLEFTIDGPTMSGSGQVLDLDGIYVPFTERAPATFSASCV